MSRPGAGATSARTSPVWTLAPSQTAAICVGVALAVLALVLARVDLALLAAPLLVTAAIAWERRPDEQAATVVTVDIDDVAADGQPGYTISVTPPAGTETVVVRVAVLGADEQVVVLSGAGTPVLRGRIPILHSGPQELVRVSHRLLGVDSGIVTFEQDPLVVERIVPPSVHAFASLPLPHRLLGLTGTHDSSRPGDGGDFRDIHPFTPGDRLRRIDWKATARRARYDGDLYVRRTVATADAWVLVVIDSRDDVGEQVSEWNSNTATKKGLSSLDVAREAAGSIASSYIRTGDRVGFSDLAAEKRVIAHGAGSRHLWRLLRAVESTRPPETRSYRQRAPQVTPGALIYVLSSFLDAEAARMAESWHHAGHRVIAVDVLPTARFDRADRHQRIAHRMVMMERADRIESLRAQGLEFLRWQQDAGTAGREAQLQRLARPARRRR